MPNSILKVKFNHDDDDKSRRHAILSKILVDDITPQIQRGQTGGTVGGIDENGSYEATWELKEAVEV